MTVSPQRSYGTLLPLIYLIAAGSACGRGTSAAGWTNESREREDVLKSEFDVQFSDAPTQLVKMVTETSFPMGQGGPRSPSLAAAVEDGLTLIVENNSGRVFIYGGRKIRELTLDDRLVYPSSVRSYRGRLYLSDDDGLKSFDQSGQRQMLLRPFLSIHDFALVTSDVVAINPIMRRSDAPVVGLVGAPGGTMTKTWGGGRARQVPGPKTAHLASCGGRIVVGLAREPVVFVLDAQLQSELEIEVPFPKKEALLSLGADERMVSPTPGVTTAPTFVAGVACIGEAGFFVLLDLPWLCILEYDFRNRLVVMHYADILRPKRHYRGLAATKQGNEIRFTTVAVDGLGPRSVLEAVAKSRGEQTVE